MSGATCLFDDKTHHIAMQEKKNLPLHRKQALRLAATGDRRKKKKRRSCTICLCFVFTSFILEHAACNAGYGSIAKSLRNKRKKAKETFDETAEEKQAAPIRQGVR